MAWEYGDENQLRLAEVIFTQRMSKTVMRPKAVERSRQIDQNALLALESAQAFSQFAEGWFEEDETDETKESK